MAQDATGEAGEERATFGGMSEPRQVTGVQQSVPSGISLSESACTSSGVT